jgi:UDP-2,3-diacylglucosamine hydrolase
VEGNRDFSIRRNYLNAPFAQVADDFLVVNHGGRRILAAHGDEVNREDRQYRLWKRVSKSFAVYGLFRLLPGRWGVALGERLERKLSGTNIRHKSYFPMEQCRQYAEALFATTCDVIVLGHFHEEREIDLPHGKVYVLPTWRGHHRYLCFEGTQPGRFVDFTS